MEKFENLKEFVLKQKYFIILGCIVVLLVIGFLYLIIGNGADNNEMILEEDILKNTITKEETVCYVKVDIKGEVEVPGLYEVKCESRVLDVINLAGGITANADTSIINLGKMVMDEMVIVILSKDEVKNYEIKKEALIENIENGCSDIKNDACIEEENIYISNKDTINTNSSSSITNSSNNEVIGDTPVNNKVSINKASKNELMTLKGIGETKADSIISYREENDGFKTLEELKNVKGIGASTFEKIKNDITL